MEFFCNFIQLVAIETEYELISRRNNILDVVSSNATLSNALASVEPEADLHADEGVEPCLAHCQVLVGAILGGRHQLDDSVLDCGQVGGRWWRELDASVTHEDAELWLGLGQDG